LNIGIFQIYILAAKKSILVINKKQKNHLNEMALVFILENKLVSSSVSSTARVSTTTITTAT
jgi:hypothetical protein